MGANLCCICIVLAGAGGKALSICEEEVGDAGKAVGGVSAGSTRGGAESAVLSSYVKIAIGRTSKKARGGG